MAYIVYKYDERFKSVTVKSGLAFDEAEKIAAEVCGWIEEGE